MRRSPRHNEGDTRPPSPFTCAPRFVPGAGGDLCWSRAFIAESKDIFSRVFEEKGVDPTPVAREYIDAMPDTFREWISMPPARRFKAGHSAISGVVVGRATPAPERSRDRAKTAA